MPCVWRTILVSSFVVILEGAEACGQLSADPDPRSSAPAREDQPGSAVPVDRAKVFAPGVRIDWRRRVVEVETRVVLRRGPLELLACSPHTREHESILSVGARPMHVFQAMGLIGLSPGSPAHYDEKRDQWIAPTGDSLDLRVCWGSGDERRCNCVERWLLDVERHRSPDKVPWVFAGSRTIEGGVFGADVDGTVVCVVDFDSALITVGALHSSDNELLWLAANTEAIPPAGTQCVLLIRGAVGRTMTVELAADGTLHHEGKIVSARDLAQASGADKPEAPPAAIVLRCSPGVSTRTSREMVGTLVHAGIDRALIEIDSPEQRLREGEPAENGSDG